MLQYGNKQFDDIVNQNREIEGQAMQWPNEKGGKGQITIYKTLHTKLRIEQHEHN